MGIFARVVLSFALLFWYRGNGRATEIGIIQYNVKGGQGGGLLQLAF